MSAFFEDERVFDARMAYGIWWIHMVSLLIWAATSFWACWRQRRMKALVGAAPSKAVLPTEVELYTIRFLAAYVVFDILRAFDPCFDSTDGVCRSIFGITPLGLRLACWGLRDVMLLWAITAVMVFYVGWTHKALGWPEPRRLKRFLWAALVVAMAGLLGSFAAMVFTNRQSYQALAMVFVVLLNVVWAAANRFLVRQVVPGLEAALMAKATGAADVDAQSGKKEDGEPKASPWLLSAISEVRMGGHLLYTANIALLCTFPLLAVERLVLKGAHAMPLIPHAPLDQWVGNATAPLISEKPLGMNLNPALEIVEILIGWLQCIYTIRVAGYDSALRPPHGPPGASPPKRGYISQEDLGSAAAAELSRASKKRQ
mmetsp:Transcript_65155/g.182196  ORF Transcript_65155/g.182196 Transcript_65155/m.182196 type:complete len:372 (-) Transcript_65155:16-1131(-)